MVEVSNFEVVLFELVDVEETTGEGVDSNLVVVEVVDFTGVLLVGLVFEPRELGGRA